jgi:hypothetical protein
MRTAMLLGFVAVLLLALFWEGPERRLAPGVPVPYEPDQELIRDPRTWQFKDAKVTSLANFRVRARVLMTAHYWWGREASVSPLDLTLGWRVMSNQEVLDGLHLYHMHRAYAWSGRNGHLPASEDDIKAHSANMHMVPATEELAGQLRALRRGDLVDIHGYLIEIVFPDGGQWRSSLSRTDTGNGSCELVWVDDVGKM